MCLRALYQVEEKFILPEGIDLDNKELVESYEVEDHVLTIKMVNGEVITVDSDDDSCRIYNPEPNETIYETDDEVILCNPTFQYKTEKIDCDSQPDPILIPTAPSQELTMSTSINDKMEMIQDTKDKIEYLKEKKMVYQTMTTCSDLEGAEIYAKVGETFCRPTMFHRLALIENDLKKYKVVDLLINASLKQNNDIDILLRLYLQRIDELGQVADQISRQGVIDGIIEEDDYELAKKNRRGFLEFMARLCEMEIVD